MSTTAGSFVYVLATFAYGLAGTAWRGSIGRPCDVFALHSPQQAEFRLEVDVVRQLQVLDEAGRLDVVTMSEDEFLVLCRRPALLVELVGAQGPVDQAHRHRLALHLPEDQAVAAGELRRL